MNTTKNTANDGMPSDIELLLPWYAAGTLDRADAQQIEAALADDPELASRLEWARAEFAQETAINKALGEPSSGDVKTLFSKIDALPARQTAPRGTSTNLAARIGEFFGGLSPRTLAWSAMAAALAIVLQAGVIADIVVKEQRAGGYQTASAPPSVAGEGAYVLIRFQPQATAADIAAFLETNKLGIVGGPSAGGVYRVRVAAAKLPPADLARIVKTLQDDKVTGFVAATD